MVYATQGSNPGLADPRQVYYSHVCASSWTVATAFAANLARFEEGGVGALDGIFSWDNGY